MKLIFHSLLAVLLVALMRAYEDAAILALAGCAWLGVEIASRLGPLRPAAVPLQAQIASAAPLIGRLLLGLVTAFLLYGLAERALTFPDEPWGPAGVGWTIAFAWVLMAAAPTLVRAWRRAPRDAPASISQPVWGLLGACLAGAPVALAWADFARAWDEGVVASRFVEGLPLLAPAAVLVVAGAELWRRSLVAGNVRMGAQGLLRVVTFGALVAYAAQVICMAAEIARVAALPPDARQAAVWAGGVFLIVQALAWIVAAWRLSRAGQAGKVRALLACLTLVLAMMLSTIPPGAVLQAADWAQLVALVMLLPLIAAVAASQTLVVWMVRRIAGSARP